MSAAQPAAVPQWHLLYADHHGWLCRWLRRRLANPGDAADLAQDTFVRLLGRPAPDQPLREPRAWLATVANGLVIDHLRRMALERAYLESLHGLHESLHPSPEERLLLIETLLRIDAMLDGLAAKARSAFLLSRLDGLAHAEIARRLGVSVSSVEKYIVSALRHCLALRGAG